MPTIKPRVTITMDSEQLEKIEEYRFNHRCKNQTQAILSLIETGFSTIESSVDHSTDKHTLTNAEIKIIKNYRELDKHGKEMVDFVLEKEAARCESERKAAESAYLVLSAAHEIPRSSEENSRFDDEIMQDENF